jgi:hypothetical protein
METGTLGAAMNTIPQPIPPPTEGQILSQIMRVLGIEARFSSALHDLRSMMQTPAVVELNERMALAAAYDSTSVTLRARAAKQPEGSDERAQTEQRAAFYDQRARVKRSGEPMPRELRTPKERLEAVAFVRDGLVQLLQLVVDVDSEDLEFFESSLVDERNLMPPKAGTAGEQFVFVNTILRAALVRLGGLIDESGAVQLLPFGIPTGLTGDETTGQGVVTSVAEGAPGPQPRVFFTPGPAPAPAPPATPNGTPANGPPST